MNGHPVTLIVEDDSDDTMLLALAFRKAQVAQIIHFVETVQEAVDYLQGTGAYANRAIFPLPSLVVVDLKLRGLSGFDLLEWVRLQPAMGGLRIGVLSGSEYGPDIQRAFELGAEFFARKPSSFEGLVAIVQELASRRIQDWPVPSTFTRFRPDVYQRMRAQPGG